LVVVSEESGLKANGDKLSTWQYLEIRMQDEVTIRRSITVPLKGWESFYIWNNLDASKFYLGLQIRAY